MLAKLLSQYMSFVIVTVDTTSMGSCMQKDMGVVGTVGTMDVPFYNK